MNLSCILIPLLVGLISALLGYLLGKSAGTPQEVVKNNSAALQLELEKCKTRATTLTNELSALKEKIKTGLQAQSFSHEPTVHVPFNAELAASVMGHGFEENDLKIIEGIGPKIEQLFKTSGILTWKSLSETSVDRCNEILSRAGEQFALHNPSTWPKQARMAYEGKWRDLKVWQDAMKGGIE